MDQKPSDKKEGFGKMRLVVMALLAVLFAAMPVSATAINFSSIVVVLSNLTTVILPQFLNLVIAYLPIAVTLAILGFILAFLDKLLGAFKL